MEDSFKKILVSGRQIIISNISMKRRQFNDIRRTQSTSCFLKLPSIAPASGKKEKSTLLSMANIQTIQSELQSIQGYTLTPNSIPSLTHYCEYHSMLKQVILNKEEGRSPLNRYIKQFNRLHSQDSVSKLFNGLIEKDQQMRKNGKFYGQQCLFDYFRLKEFTTEKIVNTIIKRVIEAKRKGLIEFEDRPKKGRSYYEGQLKENKSKIFSQSVTKFQFQQSKIYYSIITLKMLLKDPIPNMQEVNRSCQEIKVNLQLFLSNLKVREMKGVKMNRNSLYKHSE